MQAAMATVTALLLVPNHGGITAPKPPAGPPAAMPCPRTANRPGSDPAFRDSLLDLRFGRGHSVFVLADFLIELAQEAELFHSPDAMAFADLQVNGPRETWPVRTKGFKRWLARRFYEARNGAPNAEALQSALNVIEQRLYGLHANLAYGVTTMFDVYGTTQKDFWVSDMLRAGKITVEEAEQLLDALGPTPLTFWISALQSAIFNRVLDERLQQGTLLRLVEGDLAWKHDSRSVFAVTAEEIEGDELARRLESFEISPSGPLCGSGMTRAAGAVDEVEIRALQATGVPLDALMQVGYGVHGARRAMRVPIANVELDSGVDEGGNFIHLAFDLPRGAYATVLLREIMRTPIDDTANFASR